MDNKKQTVYFAQDGVPRSGHFDDIYFSVENGLDESRYNFLKGNNVPHAWQNKDSFIICELGFGTGLNFLATWQAFEADNHRPSHLTYISVEKYPLKPEDIMQAIKPWDDEIGHLAEKLCEKYPPLYPGFHTVHIADNITLILIFDDVKKALSDLNAAIDAWYLDGFVPAKNHDMWSQDVYAHMARLSHKDTSFGTFTAAGFVKRGLQEVGFEVQKQPGYGKKRERLVGVYNGDKEKLRSKKPASIAIIGGGLAGAAMAYMAHHYGLKTTIFEQGDALANGASGNEVGLLNPKLTAMPSDKNEFYGAALSLCLSLFNAWQSETDIGYDPCGAFHMITDDKKKIRFDKMQENLGWDEYLISATAEQASLELGVACSYDALYMPLSGKVSPQKLVAFMAKNATVLTSAHVTAVTSDEGGTEISYHQDGQDHKELYDICVLANGMGALEMVPHTKDTMPLSPIRGQITHLKHHPYFDGLDKNLCFGGYLTKQTDNNYLILGATYDRGEGDASHRSSDDESNLSYFKSFFPSLPDDLEICGGRAGVRVTTPDYMPICGRDVDTPNLYYSLAHRSHGILSSLLCAQINLHQMLGYASPVSSGVLQAVCVKRYQK